MDPDDEYHEYTEEHYYDMEDYIEIITTPEMETVRLICVYLPGNDTYH